MKILFVDDDVHIREIASTKLASDLNCEVVECESGNKAIQLIINDSSFDLIISDYSMADGTGHELLNFLEDKKLTIPFYLYSSRIDLNIETAYEGYRGCIHKQNFNELIISAQSILGLQNI
jgi:DNA-binding NtrC family response regulator